MATHLQDTQPIAPTTAPQPLAGALQKVEPKRLSLSLLIALVVGSMIGSGIFSLPQNMAASAGAAAILIGWLITGIGMLSLALVYQTLSNRQPALDNGVFAYARALGGEYLSFNSAWGYWISAWIGNVSYLVILFAALSYFFPLFGEGNNKAAILGASVVLWALHWMILRGMRTAARANALTTVAKIVPLLLFIGLVIAAFQRETFSVDFWGAPALGSTLDQVKSTMLVTVWVFIGIEGANVFSARAAERANVGRATVLGFLITLVLLIAVSLLSLGVLKQPELATLKNPSMAGVLEAAAGPWGAVLISVGLIISVGGALLAWTLLAAESIFTPAKEKVMPGALAVENNQGVPAHALWITNGCIQLFLLLTLYSSASYLALISLATSMILLWSVCPEDGLARPDLCRAPRPATARHGHRGRGHAVLPVAAVRGRAQVHVAQRVAVRPGFVDLPGHYESAPRPTAQRPRNRAADHHLGGRCVCGLDAVVRSAELIAACVLSW